MARYDSPGHRDPIPGDSSFQSHDSGMTAPGSTGIPALTNAGPLLDVPIVSDGWASSQLADGQPTRPVYAGDTSGMSDDLPVHATEINGTSDARPYMSTSAGTGTVIEPPRPWNAGS